MNPVNLCAASVAYGSGVLLLSEMGPPAADGLAAVASAGATALVAATQSVVVAVLHGLARPETVLAVLGPLAFVALTAVVGVMVWPATLDHVPHEEPADEPHRAPVTRLEVRRDDLRRTAA